MKRISFSSFVSYFLPCSNSHHALRDFKTLKGHQKFLAILAATAGTLASIPIGGIGGIAAFRKVVSDFTNNSSEKIRSFALREDKNKKTSSCEGMHREGSSDLHESGEDTSLPDASDDGNSPLREGSSDFHESGEDTPLPDASDDGNSPLREGSSDLHESGEDTPLPDASDDGNSPLREGSSDLHESSEDTPLPDASGDERSVADPASASGFSDGTQVREDFNENPMLEQCEEMLQILQDLPSRIPKKMQQEERAQLREEKKLLRQDLNDLLHKLHPLLYVLQDEGEQGLLKSQYRATLRNLIEAALKKNLIYFGFETNEISQDYEKDNKISSGDKSTTESYTKDYGLVSDKQLMIQQHPFLHQGRANNMLCGYYSFYALLSSISPDKFPLNSRSDFSKCAKVLIKKVLIKRLVSVIEQRFNDKAENIIPAGLNLNEFPLGSLTIDEVAHLIESSGTLGQQKTLPPICLFETDIFGAPFLRGTDHLNKSTYNGELFILAKLDDHWYLFEHTKIDADSDQLTAWHSLGYNICEDISHYYGKLDEAEAERNTPPAIILTMLQFVREAADKLESGNKDIETSIDL